MKIKQVLISKGTYKTGELGVQWTKERIAEKLGIEPQATGDTKSKYQWEFEVDGYEASIWEWKGEPAHSVWDPNKVLNKIFT